MFIQTDVLLYQQAMENCKVLVFNIYLHVGEKRE